MEAIIFIGIPASGKSTFYKQRYADTHVRINLDMLKNRKAEEMIFMACLWAQRDVVIDNTNVNRSERAYYIHACKKYNYKKITGYVFDSDVPTCIDRNILRGRPVPDKALVIKSQAMEMPDLDEGFDELHFVEIDELGFVVHNY
jgi:predicted kinase